MTIEVFYAPGSCSFAVLSALEQAEAEYSALRLDLAAGDQRTPQFLKLNPLGRVPVIVADGRTITELLGVLTYVAMRFPRANLLSLDDPAALAGEYEMLAWFSTSIHIHIAQILRGERFSSDEKARADVKATGLQQFANDLLLLESRCAEGSAYSSSRFGLVNAFGLVIWRWAQRLEIDTAQMPRWSAIVGNDLTRPAIARAADRESAGPQWSHSPQTN